MTPNNPSPPSAATDEAAFEAWASGLGLYAAQAGLARAAFLAGRSSQRPSPSVGREEINLNDTVEVVLNESGVDIMRRDHEKLYARLPSAAQRPFKAPSTTEPTKFQLWDLMQRFGPHISLGRIPPFSTEIALAQPATVAVEGDELIEQGFGDAPVAALRIAFRAGEAVNATLLTNARQAMQYAFPLLGNPYFTAEHQTTITAKKKINDVLERIGEVLKDGRDAFGG